MSDIFDNEPEAPTHNATLWAMSLADLLSILLTFFVLLYSYSHVNRIKSDRAIDGVKGTFAQPTDEKTESQVLPQEKTVDPLKLYYAEMRKVAKEILQIDDAQIQEVGNKLILRLPVYLLFKTGSAELDDKKLFLEKMADQLTADALQYNIDIEFMIGYAPAKKDDAQSMLAIARAGAFAREVVSLGVREDSVYTGMSETDPDFFTITFSPRDDSHSGLNFNKSEPKVTP